ncbi:hypothetical protein CC99x_003280 [Candidatus Berkiella cookevillensis]|uniref:Uncharacterized protein n=1 Tax=Candidatus Berkiella cookevillensis TaxID=437022 RepID=A0A0Q9YDA3_9GAMM|nr:hypothetical protein [Candidatus Berkiella cookevillensis]MCS5707921.1 hypothetical protein [Candidatus Berkiella cookevillensis]
MKLLNIAETKQASGGNSLDGVSCECWKIIGLMGFLAAYEDVTLEFALAQVDLVCTNQEQDIAMDLAKPFYKTLL